MVETTTNLGESQMKFPSIKSVAAELVDIKADCRNAEDGWIDVRLQVLKCGWSIHSGDAQYDTDHNGYWGASSVSADSNCREVARDLIQEAKDHYYQSK